MSSVVNYVKDRAHRAADFPNVIMNYWNRSNYVKPALLTGAAALSGTLGKVVTVALPDVAKEAVSLLPAVPALGANLATVFLGFGMASLAHSRQVSHVNEAALIGKKTFWKRALITGAMIGGMYAAPAATVVLAACSRPILAQSEILEEGDHPGADPSVKHDDGRVPEPAGRDALGENEQLNSDASSSSRSRDEMDEKHSSENEEREIASLVDDSYSVENEDLASETDSDSDIDEPDEWFETDPDHPDVSREERAEILGMSNREFNQTRALIRENQGVLKNTRTRSRERIRPSCEARVKAAASSCFKRVSNFCQKNASSLIAGISIAAGTLIPTLSSSSQNSALFAQNNSTLLNGTSITSEALIPILNVSLQNLALNGVLGVSVPATAIWASPKSISQQPEFVAGVAAGLVAIGSYYPTGLLVATATVAATKLGLAVKNYLFPEEED